MLDIKFIRENLVDVEKALAKKGQEYDLEKVIKLDDQKRDLQIRTETLQAEANSLAKAGERSDRAVEIKTMLKDLEPQLTEAKEKLFAEMAVIPNLPDESVPASGTGDKEEYKWGEIPQFDFEIKDHLELGESLDLIDMERAARVSGARFYYLKNQAVLLEFALINYLTDKLVKRGFTPMLVPDLVKEEAMFGTGFFPAEKNEIYQVNADGDNLYLIGTAEVPLASYHAGETLKEEELPKKYFGFSTCFRREAGTYGRDTKGIIRVHQFEKLEMFVFSKPEESWQIFEELYKINREVFEDLGLPYHQININAGELGAPNAKKIDTEVWFPSQNVYRELTSCSNDTDYQARRLNCRYQKTENGKRSTEFVHTLNNTALAIPRALVAIFENYQQPDGSIRIPEVLQKYTGFKEIKKEKK
jgi:seryl-tRNA synthetase